MSLEMSNYETVLQTVRNWPTSWRFALLQEVLESLSPPAEARRHKRDTLPRALGLLSTDRPAPSDAEIRLLLEEHRLEKYG